MVSMTIQDIVLKPFHRRRERSLDLQRHGSSHRGSSDSMSRSGFDSRPRRRHSLHSMNQGSFDQQGRQPRNSATEIRRKAAARGWYHHGGGNVVPTRIVGSKVLDTVGIAERPVSRFKTESMREFNNNPSVSFVWDCESTLYDAFEISSFSNQLAQMLQGESPSGNSSSHRPRPRLQHTVYDPLVPCYYSSTTPTSETHKNSVDDLIEGSTLHQSGVSHAAVCDEKVRKSGLRRPFLFLNKVFQNMLKGKGISVKKCSEQNQQPYQKHNHHHHNTHNNDQAPALAGEGKILPRKTLGSLFALSERFSDEAIASALV